ncbi:hypothetical protein PM082_022069 [Marasmius tenuissimus]|nr:hypothetical protein PM082_022069 [Marasmius tenuissimus]
MPRAKTKKADARFYLPPRGRLAEAPFDHCMSGQKVCIRTSDDVLFQVHGPILVLASSLFKKTLATAGDEGESLGAISYITVSEDSTTFGRFLRFFYPSTSPPVLKSFDGISAVFNTIAKYEMTNTSLIETLANSLLDLIKPNPGQPNATAFRVLALLYRHRNSVPADIVVKAAKFVLLSPYDSLPPPVQVCPELECLSASELTELLIYHRRVSDSISTLS